MNIIHTLIESSIKKDDIISKEAMQVLYNLSSKKCKGADYTMVSQNIMRLKIIQWGGFVTLYYLKSYKEELYNEIRILIKGKKLRAVIDSVKLHLARKISVGKNLLTFDDKLKIENIKSTSLKIRVRDMVLFKQEVIFPK